MKSAKRRSTPMRKLSDLDKADPSCQICKGEGWVCEDHPTEKWGYGLTGCQLPGAPCRCNPLSRIKT